VAGIPNTKEMTCTDGSGPTGDCFNVNTAAGQTEIPNGKAIQGYSDAYVTPSWKITGGGLAPAMSATSPDPGANGTIATAGVGIALVTPAAARTGIILQPGTINGQVVEVVNQGAAANTLTAAAAGTSNIADGTSDVITGLTAARYIWIGGSTNLWYRVKAS
jgi:hypothetical protein